MSRAATIFLDVDVPEETHFEIYRNVNYVTWDLVMRFNNNAGLPTTVVLVLSQKQVARLVDVLKKVLEGEQQ